MSAPRYQLTRDGRTARLNRHESRMVHRGRQSGFRRARYRGHLARLYPAEPCPYPEGGRPRELWQAGEEVGAQEGLRELLEVRVSYRKALAALDRPGGGHG